MSMPMIEDGPVGMEFAMSSRGLMVHDRGDWPCACCRPNEVSDSGGFCLCLKCARGILRAVEAGFESMRSLLDDVTDALTLLQGVATGERLAVN